MPYDKIAAKEKELNSLTKKLNKSNARVDELVENLKHLLERYRNLSKAMDKKRKYTATIISR